MNRLQTATAFVLLLIGLCSQSTHAAGGAWSYEGLSGPSHWGKDYPDCDRNSQSPINIYEGDVTPNGVTEAFSYKNYDVTSGLTMTLSNSGHGFVVSLSGSKLPEITGGELPGDFVAAQFHFHWSGDEKRGSEHLISSEGFPSELHIVHYNKKYPDIATAMTNADGLAVLGFMLEISATDNADYDNILSALPSVVNEDSEPVVLPAQTMNSYLPESFSKFFRYSGSLTTPPCYETVTWTVFKETIKISRNQLAVFLEVMDKDNLYVLDNVRPVQPLHGREVKASFDPEIRWGYYPGNFDPPHWGDYYLSCGGQSQSPVNIPSSASTKDDTLVDFTYTGFDSASDYTMELSNNGHTVTVSLNGSVPSVTGGSLSSKYKVVQFHFHWGSSSTKGSEHTLDSARFPMEMHVVTYKASDSNLENALRRPEGLAVLGFFFEIADDDNPALKPILDELKSVKEPYTKKAITPAVAFDSFLPADRSKYYRYSGGLTTPNCEENVVWSVFDSKISISEAQMNLLRELKSSEVDPRNNAKLAMVDNFRPVQFLNSRTIRRNFDVAPKPKIHWSYFGDKGYQNWRNLFTMCSKTDRQSPIDIKPKEAQFMDIPQFKYKNFGTAINVTMKLKNNGHAVVVSYQTGDLQISEGGLEDTYNVAQFHFHWGSVNRQGSEHAIGGSFYPMELHVVTSNTKYSDISLAMTQGNGLAVLGFMLQVTEKDNPALEAIVSHLHKIQEAGDEVSIPAFALSTILPKEKKEFFRYDGSLTTPTCDESVTWSVFYNTISISEKQLNAFRGLDSSELDDKNNTMPLVDNFRPVQPTGHRVVYSNFYLSAAPAKSHKVSLVASIIFTLGKLAPLFD